MKVLLVNGSPHKEGCTYTALTEAAVSLEQEGIGTDIFWIGNKPLSGCIACYNEFDPERTRKKRVAQRLIPKLQ